MARVWVMDSKALARNVKNAGRPPEASSSSQIKNRGAYWQCSNCQYCIDNPDVSQNWPGLPAGVKFDPSDVELLDHLAAKYGTGDLKQHVFINDYIPTLEDDEGICYTHPEHLPGARKDGSVAHYFYRITNGYSHGRRKLRRIEGQESAMETHFRWHQTGKSKPVMQNGLHKGFKKFMVLKAWRSNSKQVKLHWAMHQYHLGTDVNEKEGDYVVSKIFYQPQKENAKNESCLESENFEMKSDPQSGFLLEGKMEYATNLAEWTQAFDLGDLDSQLWNEIIDSQAPFDHNVRPNNTCSTLVGDFQRINGHGNGDAAGGVDYLYNIELGSPSDFPLDDLQFPSQDIMFDWWDDSKQALTIKNKNLSGS